MFKFLIILPSLLLKKTVYFFRFRSAILPKRKTLSTRNMSPAGDDIVSDHDRKFIELRKECVTKSWLNKSVGRANCCEFDADEHQTSRSGFCLQIIFLFLNPITY